MTASARAAAASSAGCWARARSRAGGLVTARRPGGGWPLPTKPETLRCTTTAPTRSSTSATSSVHFQLQGGALSRLFGLRHRHRQGRRRRQPDRSAAARSSGWSGSPGAARPRSDARCSAWCPAPAARSTPRPRARRPRRLRPEGSKLRELRTDMQMVFQDPHAALNPAMTMEEAVGHPLVIHGIAKGRGAAPARRRRAREGRSVAGGAVPAEVPLATCPAGRSSER